MLTKTTTKKKNNTQVRAFGVFIMLILVLPMIMGVANRGLVLGVSDDAQRVNITSSQPTPAMISSGVIEDNSSDSFTDKQVLSGNIVYDQDVQTPLFNEQIPLGKEVKLITKQAELEMVVNKNASPDQKELAVVSKGLFVELGGDPAVEKTIFAEIEFN